MPQRFLRPEIVNSERWNAVSMEAQSLYIRLLARVDDYGRHDGRPAVVCAECFAVWNELHPEARFSVETTAKLLLEIAEIGLVTDYYNREKRVLQFAQWRERKRENVRSKWPCNPAFCSETVGLCASCREPQISARGNPPPNAHAHAYVYRTGGSHSGFTKPTVEECKSKAIEISLPESEGEAFWNYYESNGWRVGKNLMRSWHGAIQNWKRNFHLFKARGQRPPPSRNEGTMNA